MNSSSFCVAVYCDEIYWVFQFRNHWVKHILLSGPCHPIVDAEVEFPLVNCMSRNSTIVETQRQRESGKFSCDCGKREL